jgi:hypothetical protein
MIRLASIACMAAALLAYSGQASAQEFPPEVPAQGSQPDVQNPAPAAAPAHIAVVDGVATLEREGRPDTAPTSMPLLSGDRLRTADGRVEVMFGDGSALHLDTNTIVDFQSDEVIRLLEGRVRITIPGPPRQVSYRIDAPGGWVEIQEPGEYRVGTGRGGPDAQVELVVLRGAADLLNQDGQTTLRAGERAFARAGAAPSYAYVFNSAAWDDFDRWSEQQRDAREGVSAQYLPETVRPYSATFDRYGSWQYDTSYGYVWYPRVDAGWRPYYNGRWASFPAFGWTWIGADAWAWPTHHYGRWGISAGAWFWIPGRTWGPAWVSWAYAPGYVSWCPLGWDNRPAVIFSASYYSGRYDPWRAWTVIPRQRFGTGFVSINVVAGARIDARTRSAFVVRQAAPQIRGHAVPRTAVPIYAAGTRASAARSYGRTPFGVETYRGSVRSIDETSAFRSRRRETTTRVGPGYPAPARTPREGGAVGAGRSADTAGIPVYRGSAIPRERSAGSPVSTPPARLEVPGYRRAPAPPGANPPPDRATRPTPRTFSVPERTAVPRRSGGASPYPAPYQAAPAGPAAPSRGARPAPARPAGDLYQATPRTYGRERPAPARAPSPAYGGESRPSATPRAGPPSRSAGPPQRMAEPPQRIAPPPQRMAAPPRESRAPAVGPAPRSAPEGRPAGRPEGRAVARPRNR